MSIGNLLFHLTPEQKLSFRKLESLLKKLSNAEYAVVFNNACLEENLLPRFTHTHTNTHTHTHTHTQYARRFDIFIGVLYLL